MVDELGEEIEKKGELQTISNVKDETKKQNKRKGKGKRRRKTQLIK